MQTTFNASTMVAAIDEFAARNGIELDRTSDGVCVYGPTRLKVDIVAGMVLAIVKTRDLSARVDAIVVCPDMGPELRICRPVLVNWNAAQMSRAS